MAIATKEIEAERANSHGEGEFELLSPPVRPADAGDTSYHGV